MGKGLIPDDAYLENKEGTWNCYSCPLSADSIPENVALKLPEYIKNKRVEKEGEIEKYYCASSEGCPCVQAKVALKFNK